MIVDAFIFFGVEDNDFLVTVMSRDSARLFHSAMYRINKLTYFVGPYPSEVFVSGAFFT